MTKWRKYSASKKSKFWRNDGPVDVLIGIDNPLLHTGETRQLKSLIARHSLLGWVLFGTTAGRNEPAHQVFHIKTVMLPAVDMADFWSTESMGVTVKTCSCDSETLVPLNCKKLNLLKHPIKVGNQLEVSYLWKRDPSILPDN